jgi:hypothetical protein
VFDSLSVGALGAVLTHKYISPSPRNQLNHTPRVKFLCIDVCMWGVCSGTSEVMLTWLLGGPGTQEWAVTIL